VTGQIDQEERPVAHVASLGFVAAGRILHRNVISPFATTAGARIGRLLLIPAFCKPELQPSMTGAKAAKLKPHRAPANQVVQGWRGSRATDAPGADPPAIPKSDGDPDSKKPRRRARLSA
jgi:hypothetical protein